MGHSFKHRACLLNKQTSTQTQKAEAEVPTIGALPAPVPIAPVMNAVNPPPRRFLLSRASTSSLFLVSAASLFSSLSENSSVLQNPQQSMPVNNCPRPAT